MTTALGLFIIVAVLSVVGLIAMRFVENEAPLPVEDASSESTEPVTEPALETTTI